MKFRKKLVRLNGMLEDRNKLLRLIDSAKKQHIKCKKKIVILFAPGFNIGRTFTHHDVIIASLLHAKGCQIHYTGGMGRLNHPFYYGGVWRLNSTEDEFRKAVNGDNRAVRYFDKFSGYSDMNSFVEPTEVQEFKKTIAKLDIKELTEFSYCEVPLGHDAMNRVRNMHMVCDLSLIENHEALLKDSLVNCMVYFVFFDRVINTVKPDRIFSHDSFYYPWSIMQKLADRYGIPFYNYYCAIRKDAYIYANNQPAMLLNMDKLWNNVKDEPLSNEQKSKVLNLIEERKHGNTGRLKQKRVYDKIENNQVIEFAGNYPTAVLYGNVVWDLAALDKDIIFPDIQTAYVQTVLFFIAHPELRLIIKPHPDETNSRIPTTMEQLNDIIEKNIGELPANVLLLSNKSAITAYDLFQISKCSLVYTTTTGIESTIAGTPTITLGDAHYRNKGFTRDPHNIDEYYQILNELLNHSSAPKNMSKFRDQAIKYFYYFYYELFTDYGIPSNSYYNNVSPIFHKSLAEFLKNPRLEFIIDSIIEGKTI